MTVGFFLLLVLLVALRHNKLNLSKTSLISNQDYFTIGFFLLSSFFIFYLLNGSPNELADIVLHYDYHYYSKLSDELPIVGVENRNALMKDFVTISKPDLYHFFEIWSNSALGFVLKNPSSLNFVFVILPSLLFIFLTGLTGIIRELTTTKYSITLGPLVLIILLSISYKFNVENVFYLFSYKKYGGILGSNIALCKTLYLGIFCLFATGFYVHKKRWASLIFVTFIPLSFPTTLPFFAALIVLITSYFILKKYSLNLITSMIVWCASIILLYFLVLFYFRDECSLILGLTPLQLSEKSILIISIENILGPLVVYFVGIVFAIVILVRKSREKLLMAVTAYLTVQLSSSFLFIMLFDTIDSSQILTNVIPWLFTISTSIIIGQMFYKLSFNSKLWFAAAFAILGSLQLLQMPQPQSLSQSEINFRSQVFDELDKNNDVVNWLTVNNKSSQLHFYSWNPPGFFMLNHESMRHPLDITPLVLSEIEDWCILTEGNGKTILCDDAIKNQSIEGSIMGFIEKYKIVYLYTVNKNLLPKRVLDKFSIVCQKQDGGDVLFKLN